MLWITPPLARVLTSRPTVFVLSWIAQTFVPFVLAQFAWPFFIVAATRKKGRLPRIARVVGLSLLIRSALVICFLLFISETASGKRTVLSLQNHAPLIYVLIFGWDIGWVEMIFINTRIDLSMQNDGVDPFSHSKLGIRSNGDLYSIGPDMRDDRGELLYDPTNGTFSPGDIYPVKGNK
jgi:hypothetical protein